MKPEVINLLEAVKAWRATEVHNAAVTLGLRQSAKKDLDALTHQLRIAADHYFKAEKKTKPEKYVVLFKGCGSRAPWLFSAVNPKLSGATAKRVRGLMKRGDLPGRTYQIFPVSSEEAKGAIKWAKLLGFK